MFWLIVADQGISNRLNAFLATNVTHGRKLIGISLSCNDRTDDLHARDAGYRRYHMMQLEIHESERLLHGLDRGCGVIGMPFPCAQVGTQFSNIATGPKARPQQTTSMQPLQPLCVIDAALSARDGARFAGVGQDDFETLRLEYLIGRPQ